MKRCKHKWWHFGIWTDWCRRCGTLRFWVHNRSNPETGTHRYRYPRTLKKKQQ